MTPAESLPPLDAGALKRFELDYNFGYRQVWMAEVPEGRYVLHADHVAAIEKLAEERDACLRVRDESLRVVLESHNRINDLNSLLLTAEHDRDKALADLVAVTAERDEARKEFVLAVQDLNEAARERDAARDELARVREALADLLSIHSKYTFCGGRDLPTVLAEARAVLATTLPTRSAP